jgi:hypothetical protein
MSSDAFENGVSPEMSAFMVARAFAGAEPRGSARGSPVELGFHAHALGRYLRRGALKSRTPPRRLDDGVGA